MIIFPGSALYRKNPLPCRRKQLLRFKIACDPLLQMQAFESCRCKDQCTVFPIIQGQVQALSTDDYYVPDSKLIIPQSLLQSGSYHPKLIVEYQIQVGKGAVETKTAECHFDINLRQESWVMGMEYTYTIHIGVGQYPIEFAGTVADWSAVDNGKVNIGEVNFG